MTDDNVLPFRAARGDRFVTVGGSMDEVRVTLGLYGDELDPDEISVVLVLVRLITRDDDEQVALADAFVRKGAWVSHLVLAEMTRAAVMPTGSSTLMSQLKPWYVRSADPSMRAAQ